MAKRKKMLRYAAWCTALTFAVSVITPLKYEARATFRQSVAQPGKSVDLKKLIQAVSVQAPSETVSGILLSNTVLRKVVHRLGLQIEQPAASLLSTVKDKLLAEVWQSTPRVPPYVFSSVSYTGEKKVRLWIEPLSENTFELYNRTGHVVARGLVGVPVVGPLFELTLHSPPKRGRITLQPEMVAIARLRKQLSVKPSREDHGLLRIQSASIFREQSQAVANTLMGMYKELLVEENELVVGAQLSYLNKRQEELEMKLARDVNSHAARLQHNLHEEGVLGIKGEGENLLTPLYAHQRRLHEIGLALEKIGSKEHTASLSPLLIKRYAELLHNEATPLRRQLLQEGETFIHSMEADLSGISLSAAESLVEQYSRQMDALHTSLKEAIFMRDHLFDPHFELGALSTVLSDTVSTRIIDAAVAMESELRDDFRSTKEKSRAEIKLASHKKLLSSHLERTLELGALRVDLIKEKLGTLFAAIKTLLLQEKRSLEHQIGELKQSMQALPHLWADEHKLQFKQELTKTMMKGLTNVAESKNLAHHLYQVESRPLDHATLPLEAVHPHLLLRALLAFTLGGLLCSLFLIVPPLLRGQGVTLATLQELGFHISGMMSAPSTFEKLALFLLAEKKPQIVACVGTRQTGLFAPLTALLDRHHKRCCVIDCSLEKISSQEPGLVQALSERTLPLLNYPSYAFLPSGGFMPHSSLLLTSPTFQTFTRNLSTQYDFLFLSVQLPLDALASQAILCHSDTAIVSVDSFSDRDKITLRATFIQYPVIVEKEGFR